MAETNTFEDRLADMVAKNFTRTYGPWWKASAVLTETVGEAMVAAEVMSIIVTQEDSIKEGNRDMAARIKYATIYRTACKKLFPWWAEAAE